MDISIMKLETIELRKITADEGKVLTNGKDYSDVGGHTFLAYNEDAKNWYEITEEEAINLQEQLLKDLEANTI